MVYLCLLPPDQTCNALATRWWLLSICLETGNAFFTVNIPYIIILFSLITLMTSSSIAYFHTLFFPSDINAITMGAVSNPWCTGLWKIYNCLPNNVLECARIYSVFFKLQLESNGHFYLRLRMPHYCNRAPRSNMLNSFDLSVKRPPLGIS